MLMVRFFDYITNKPKIDDQLIFSDMVMLTEPCSPLVYMLCEMEKTKKKKKVCPYGFEMCTLKSQKDLCYG